MTRISVSFLRALVCAALLQLCVFLTGLVGPLVSAASAAPDHSASGRASDERAESEDDGVPSIQLGHEYTEYNKTGGKGGSGPHKTEHDPFVKALLYLPNRIVDLFEIFRFDVGVGPAAGAVVRVTKYGQVGLRSVQPFSLRAGLAGRHSPVFLETSSEFGIGPAYVSSHDRHVQTGEVGAGIDFFIVGAYVGLDIGAIPDFFAGIAGYDPSDDDF
ncbi:MAG: hypothetical protein U0136_02485 [Bdellovibrionota bacterium]